MHYNFKINKNSSPNQQIHTWSIEVNPNSNNPLKDFLLDEKKTFVNIWPMIEKCYDFFVSATCHIIL